MPGRRVSQSKKTMPDSSGYSLHPATGNTRTGIVSPIRPGNASACESSEKAGARVAVLPSRSRNTKNPFRTGDDQAIHAEKNNRRNKKNRKAAFHHQRVCHPPLENKSPFFEIPTRQIVRKGMVYDRLFPVCETCRFLPSGIAVFRPLRRFPVRQIGFRLMRFSAFSSVPFPI